MRIGVLGTGTVGRTLAARLTGLGHEIRIGTRDAAATLARSEPGPRGELPYAAWQQEHPTITLGDFADAASYGELVVNATAGGSSLTVLEAAGKDNLAGKVLLDVANPLDFSGGFPPTLLVKDTDSLGEQVQRLFPDARVVKALNTMTAAVMVDPGLVAGGEHTVFVCGDDPTARETVTELLRSVGWRDIVDLGDISAARGTEMVLPIWLRLMSTLGHPLFNFKVAR